MSRATYGAARHRSKKRAFRNVKGYRGARGTLWYRVQEAIVRAGVYAYRDRRAKKRNYRALWVTRITAACRARGMSYSRFIYGLINAGVALNRKMLSEVAIHNPTDFDQLVEISRSHQSAGSAAA